MTIFAVADAFAKTGLAPPTLNALVADANNYSALLLQPQGEIEATTSFIRTRNRDLATAQFGRFLEDARTSQPDLVVTPEYSVPWVVLTNAINGTNSGPAEGKLWALGCESIRYSELQQWKRDLVNIAEVIFEPMQADDTRFVDPLAYVFRAPGTEPNAGSKLVVLVQFKTHAMGGDPHDFERNHLQLGTRIYQFGNYGGGISLTSFICSDFLGFTDGDAGFVRDRGLILHLQLNDKRQHAGLRAFRERLLKHVGKSTEIVTLNWARDTHVHVDGHDTGFRKFAGSSWCVKADDIDLADETVAANHRSGMYYTWLSEHRTHTMFLNFSPAAFAFTASKVERIGVNGPAGNRRGPQLDGAKTWDAANNSWRAVALLDDGFTSILAESGNASTNIRAIYDVCPLACERLVSLCGGTGITRNDWHTVSQLKSFSLPPDELVHRLTFCQPVHATSFAFRREQLRRCSHLWNALTDTAHLPAVLNDTLPSRELKWSGDKPHQNLRGKDGEAATVVYLGESTRSEAESVHGAIRKRLHQSLPEDIEGHEHNPHSTFRAKQRVAVWYSDNVGQRQLYVKIPRISDGQDDPADIRRAS
jgi:hypothetical protein